MSEGLSALIKATGHNGQERFRAMGPWLFSWLFSAATPDEWDTLGVFLYSVPANVMNSFKKTVARLLDRNPAKAGNLRGEGVGGNLITFFN